MQPNNYFSDFDDLFDRMTQDRWGVLGRYNRPGYESGEADFAVDIAHHDDEIVVTADVPGFEKEDFDISVDGDLLTIRAESDVESSVDEDAYVRRERRHHTMRRTIRLPADVDGEGANAIYRNGVLTVSIPVEADVDVRHIDVE
ncbi:Hsp20/alpha crystallin family protein [Haloplanus aerogenes]|uniref:HSP20 family protein n=1 Tax=Haloplanus aerogenes TaxID=660522 RepID=A0A3M0E675_9EURY|nr:Hsp20/alpha crystallin family protein [Haloplanus aerogenes]AZH24678.1 Hsp20/alpha crystallin family protein [Haloplanus aerogenes]RMB23663.1 HSP20 family protein [Haloplanus aerogenes]